MAVVTPPLYLDVDSYYGAKELGLPYRDILGEGVMTVASDALKVTQRGAGANMSVDVAAGSAWILGDSTSVQPLYRCYNDGTVNVAVTTADPTNPRIDRVIAEVRDATFAGAFSDWRIRIVAGTPAGSPAAPALPSNAISLATLAVAAADTTIVTGDITDLRTDATLGSGTAALAVTTPTGSISMYGGVAAPSGYLLCNGTAQSRTTYEALFETLVTSKGTFTVTIATPGVFTLNGHGLVAGDGVYFSTTSALPTGLTAETTTYYVISAGLTANAFQVSTTRGGSAVNTTGSQSGTHTAWFAPYGVSSSTTFLTPDMRGRVPVGYAPSSGHADVAALAMDDSVVIGNRRPKHRHTAHSHTQPFTGTGGSSPYPNYGDRGSSISVNLSGSSVDGGSGNANDSLDAPAYLVVNYIIKT